MNVDMLVNSLLINKGVINSKRYGEDIIDLCTQTFTIPYSFDFKTVRVNKLHIARPDLLSYHLYGSPEYGDLICKINGISNPFELNEGMYLVVPEFQDIEKFMVIDSFDNDEDRKNTNIPKPKARKEKRTANEAIIGDKRFRIDKENRVIIY